MNETKAVDLSRYRLGRAKDLLKQAEILLENSAHDGSVNRSYYAIFYAVRALLALIEVDSRKHRGVISLFDRYFVKTGICRKELSHILHSAFDVRQTVDYEDFHVPSGEEASRQYSNAKKMVREIHEKFTLITDGKLGKPVVEG